LLAALWIAPVSAALFLVFETHGVKERGTTLPNTAGRAAAGTIVSVRTGGHGAMGELTRMPVFLVSRPLPERLPDAAALRALPGVTPLGYLRADAEATGHLEFEVPQASPGRYDIYAYCRTCPRFASGSVAYLAPFQIDGPAEPAQAPATGGVGVATLLGAGALLAGAVILGAIAVRRSPPE
jgi:hypothetical protein